MCSQAIPFLLYNALQVSELWPVKKFKIGLYQRLQILGQTQKYRRYLEIDEQKHKMVKQGKGFTR